MTRRLDNEPDIKALAAELGLPSTGETVTQITEYCLTRVENWCAPGGTPQCIAGLEDIVARNLQLVFEDVSSDDELDRVIEKYVGLGEGVFRFLKHDLDSDTFGVTIRRKQAAREDPDRYIAVIDCRGDKAARKFFTRWHEIAHLLVLTKDLEAPVKRATDAPLERLMDEIAAQVGFYRPIFDPVFASLLSPGELITFAVAEKIRKDHFPEASFQATLFAALRRHSNPTVYVEAGLALKAGEARAVNRSEQWLFEDAKPSTKLRAIQVVPNPAAVSSRMFIPSNMRIPAASVIQRLFVSGSEQELAGAEDLESWEHSNGKSLDSLPVWIEARKVRERIFAIIQAR